MTERERLLRRIATVDFAIVELHLYLDTHPDAMDIKNKLDEYEEKSSILKEEYETKYGPLTPRDNEDNNWEWVSNPWPWDNDEEEE